jgi:hypothetical protein
MAKGLTHSPLTSQPFNVIDVDAGIAVRPPIRLSAFGICTNGKLGQRQNFMAPQTLFTCLILKAFSVVLAGMLSLANYFKIFNSVIKSVAVFVVHDFSRKWQQFTPQVLFHNEPMLKYLLPVHGHSFVSTLNSSCPRWSALAGKRITVSSQAGIMTRTIALSGAWYSRHFVAGRNLTWFSHTSILTPLGGQL